MTLKDLIGVLPATEQMSLYLNGDFLCRTFSASPVLEPYLDCNVESIRYRNERTYMTCSHSIDVRLVKEVKDGR